MVIIADCIKFFGEVCIGDMPICFTDIYSPIGYRPVVFFPVVTRTWIGCRLMPVIIMVHIIKWIDMRIKRIFFFFLFVAFMADMPRHRELRDSVKIYFRQGILRAGPFAKKQQTVAG